MPTLNIHPFLFNETHSRLLQFGMVVPLHSSDEELPRVGVARENICAVKHLHLLAELFPIAMFCMQQQQPNGVLQTQATCTSCR